MRAAMYDNSYALIIAIDEYRAFPHLTTAVRGGNAFEDLLRTKFDFITEKLIDRHATQTRILEWLERLPCGEHDRVLIYFAGHGLARPASESSSISYLVLSETRAGLYSSALRLSHLFEEAEHLACKHTLFILDACMVRFPGTRASMIPDTNVLEHLDTYLQNPERYVITASDGKATDDRGSPERQYSTFTYYLLRGLHGEAFGQSGLLTGRQLGQYLVEQIQQNAQSAPIPQHGCLLNSSEGDFIFMAQSVPIPAQTVDLAQCQVRDQTGKLTKDQKALLQQLRHSQKLNVLEEITIGQSGSAVFLVDASPRSEAMEGGQYFCKIYRTPSGQEVQAHQRASQTPMKWRIPQIVDSTPVVEGWMATLYRPAHHKEFGQTRALSDLMVDDASAALENVNTLLKFLGDWNDPLNFQHLRPQELLVRALNRYPAKSIAATIEKFVKGLVREDTTLLFADQVLPNPIAYLIHAGLWAITLTPTDKRPARPIAWPSGHLHGDLHSGNVLCLQKPGSDYYTDPVLIDFDTYTAGNLVFFDLAYFEIDICMRMLNPEKAENRQFWLKVSPYLAGQIQLDTNPRIPSIPAEAFYLNLILQPIRKKVLEFCRDGGRPNDYSTAFWIARAAAGLAFARKRKVNTAQRMLALYLSAQSLDNVLRFFRIPKVVNQQPYFVHWRDFNEPPPTGTWFASDSGG